MKHGRNVILDRVKGTDVPNERGAVLPLIALFFIILMTAAALAIDLSSLADRGQTLQNTADAAALAGVVEYQTTLLATGDAGQADTAARATIDQVIQQNGLDLAKVEVTVDYPDGASPAVRVSILDEDPASFIGATIGFDPDVTRGATAEFVACGDACNITIKLPEPVSSIDAAGTGDGYKPIAVEGEDKIYAINHNAPGQSIVCVSRQTQAGCWADTDAGRGVERYAYSAASGYTASNDRNPEMPHAGVVDKTIYWSATSDFDGHLLFCWETETDTPCNNAIPMGSDLLRGDENTTPLTSPKDENRGGGTIAYRNKIFVFTDNHQIHCWDPRADSYCAGYTGPFGSRPTALGASPNPANAGSDGFANFPVNLPEDGNHGSSIDRIVDAGTGRIYSTIHIDNAVDVLTCSASLENPLGQQVVLRNAETGGFLDAVAADDVRGSVDALNPTAHWEITTTVSGSVFLRSVGLNAFLDGRDSPVGTSPALNGALVDDEWNLVAIGDSYQLDSTNFGGLLSDEAGAITKEDPALPSSTWDILPIECGDPSFVEPIQPADYYSAGTWLHCFDTGILSGIPGPCPGFLSKRVDGTPGPLHENASRFSGRLFFYYNNGGTAAEELGVCSSGYGASFQVSSIEINCVDLNTGDFSSAMTNDMGTLRSAIAANTGTDPGAWGDPHWNQSENRLFYPTEHDTSRVLCWDFDTGWCGSRTGTVPPNASGETTTEDYGFFSDELCVYGLGHHALFWAFDANDLNEPCKGAQKRTPIQRCPCAGLTPFEWGVLDFSEVNLANYEKFEIQITTSPENDGDPSNDDDNPVVLFPADGSFYSIKPGGADPVLDLDEAGISPDLVWVEILVYVETEVDPILLPDEAFTLTFPHLPSLTE